MLFQKCPAQTAYLNKEKEMAGEQRIKVTLRWEFWDPNYLKVNSAMRDRA